MYDLQQIMGTEWAAGKDIGCFASDGAPDHRFHFLNGRGAYSAESERGFHVIVNSRCVSGADDTDMGSSVHDDIGDGRIPAMPCSDSQPTRNVSVAGFVAGGAGGVITQIAANACCARLQKRYGGRHTAKNGQSSD